MSAVTSAAVSWGRRAERAARAAEHVAGARRRVGAVGRALRDALAEALGLLGERGEEQVVLRRVVAVERAERDLGAGRDVAHLHRVVAAGGGELDRGGDHALPACGGLERGVARRRRASRSVGISAPPSTWRGTLAG